MKYLKIFELNKSEDVLKSLIWKYGDIINDIDIDIQFIEDKLLEIGDLGYYTYVNYTPMTYAGYNKFPTIYMDIKKRNTGVDFYGNLGQNREIINIIIEEILYHMEIKGYKMFQNFDKPLNPSEFIYINNPTSYQIQFKK